MNEHIEKINREFWNVRDHFKGMDVETIKQWRMKLPYAIAVENLAGDLNVGMIVRTAEILGCQKIWIVGKKRYDKRSTVGAHNYIEIAHAATIDDITDDYTFFGIENTENALDIGEVRVPLFNALCKMFNGTKAGPCFILGCEANGLSEESLAKCEAEFIIPQFGVLRCLNVSSAASIAMYEISKNLTNEIKES